MAFGSTTVANADLRFTATTGPAKAGVEELRRTFRQATGGMSDDALRLQAAQLRADDAIARSHGKVNRSTIAAELNLRKLALEQDRAAGNARRAGSAYNSEARDIERFGRGALVGTGALRGLGRAAAFASTSFLGGAGLIYTLRHVVEEQATVQEETEKTGVVFGRNAADVQRWAGTLSASFGVSEAAALKAAGTFGNMLIPLHFGEGEAAAMSKRLVELAADMASFNNASPATVLQAIASGLAGQVRPLRQYGVFLSQARIQEEALADGIAKRGAKLTTQQKVQAAYNIILKDTKNAQGDVARNTGSLSVAWSKLTAALSDTESGSNHLLKATVDLTNRAAVWLGDTKNQERIQRDLNKAVDAGTKIVHGLVDAERLIAPPIKLAVGALGGLEHAAELAFIIGVVGKARKAALAFGLIQAASTKTAAAIAADSLAEQAALERTAAVAATTAGVVARVGAYTGGVPPVVPVPSGRGGGRGIPAIGGPLVTGLALAGWVELHGLSGTGSKTEATGTFAGHPAAFKGGEITIDAGGGYSITYDPKTRTFTQNFSRGSFVEPSKGVAAADAAKRLNLTLAQLRKALAPKKRATPTAGTSSPWLVLPKLPKHEADYLTPAQQRAQALAENPNALSALTGQRDYDVNAIAFLKKRFAAGKIANTDYIKQLQALESDEQQQQSQIDQIHADASRKRDDASRKAAAAERARERKTAAAERARERKYRAGLATEALHLGDQATQELRAETKGIRTKTVGGKVVADSKFVEPAAQRELVAFYKREADDTRLSGAEQARYHHLYISELGKVDREQETFDRKVTSVLKAARKKQADRLKEQQQLRDAILQNRLSAAQLAETQAGTNAVKVSKARKRELTAELAILAEEKKAGKGLTGLAKQQNIADQLATRTAIAQLRNQLAPAKADTGANERQFLSSFADIVRNFAPNAFPAKAGTHLYELVHETRTTNKHLAEIKVATKFPGTRGFETAVQAAFG